MMEQLSQQSEVLSERRGTLPQSYTCYGAVGPEKLRSFRAAAIITNRARGEDFVKIVKLSDQTRPSGAPLQADETLIALHGSWINQDQLSLSPFYRTVEAVEAIERALRKRFGEELELLARAEQGTGTGWPAQPEA